MSSNSIFAAAHYKNSVSIWDLSTRTQKIQFDTIHDTGGHRIAIEPSGEYCITGSYYEGIACYHSKSGELVWRKKEYKKIQRVRISPQGKHVYLGFDEKPMVVLGIENGELVDKLKSVRDIYFSKYSSIMLLKKNTRWALCDFNGDVKSTMKPESFGILGVSFSNNYMLISEAGKDIRCFNLSKYEETWRYSPPNGSHFLGLNYSEHLQSFFAVLHPFQNGGSQTLFQFCESNGELIKTSIFGKHFHNVSYSSDAKELITADGKIFNTDDGSLVDSILFSSEDAANP